MDLYIIFRLLIVILTILIMLFIPALILHVKEAFLWRRSIRRELDKIRKETRLFRKPKRQALAIVEKKCRMLYRSTSTGIEDFSDLTDYIKQIARCYHPDALYPELRVTAGHILYCLERSFERYDKILERPGFKDISSINIKTLKSLKALYKETTTPGGATRIPFSSKVYLFKNLSLLFLARYLVTDLYLFFGMLAVEIYDEALTPVIEDKKKELEETLRELSMIRTSDLSVHPDEILTIRNTIVGMPKVLMADPTFEKWKTGLKEAARCVAAGYFPDSDNPVDEANIGPLLTRFRSWLSLLGKGEGYPVAGRLYKIRLETLLQARTISDTLIPAKVRKIIINTQKTYSLLKWPINIYMWASKGAFWKIAVDAGWFAGRKAILVFAYGKAFDKAVTELDTVYRLSKTK